MVVVELFQIYASEHYTYTGINDNRGFETLET